MKVAVFSAKPYDRQFLEAANHGGHGLRYLDCRLTVATADQAKGASAVCLFGNDDANATVLMAFAHMGVRLIALRAAGFNNVDLKAARAHSIAVARVPAYSPNAVAEHTFALILALARKIPQALIRIREGDFSLDGLIGFNLAGKTLGIVGVGNIGSVVAQIGKGFGCTILAADPVRRADCEAMGVRYVDLGELLACTDIVTLHCPLNETTRHLIDADALRRMKPCALLINTSRGAVIDTKAVISALEHRQLGALGIDVYEREEGLFFEDHRGDPVSDPQFDRLLAFPNVLVTGHQAFFTIEAMTSIASTTIGNIDAFEKTGRPLHPVGEASQAIPPVPAVALAPQGS